MPDKTKAALQGRQCSYKKLKPSQITTLIDQVNNLGRVANMQLGITMHKGQAKRCDKKCIGHKLTAPLAQLVRDIRKSAHTILNYGKLTVIPSAILRPLILLAFSQLKSFSTWWVYPNLDRPDMSDSPQRGTSKPMADPQRRNSSSAVQPFGSMPRDCSSFLRIRFIQVASEESPSFFISVSSCARNSCWRRIWYWSVFAFSLDIVITKSILSVGGCNYNVTEMVLQLLNTAKPGSVSPLTGPLTTNDSLSIEVAMLNHTPTRFKFLFLAVCRSDLNAKPHRESVTANSEQDARRSLASQFVLSFAGRLPEVSHG